jgi:hypothetical protein
VSTTAAVVATASVVPSAAAEVSTTAAAVTTTVPSARERSARAECEHEGSQKHRDLSLGHDHCSFRCIN